MNIENALTIDAPVQITETGLRFNGDLSFDQWSELGRKVGRVARTSQFLVGDWLVYGQVRWNDGERFEKMPEDQYERYRLAMQDTGLEFRTLMDAAYVARNIPIDQRRSKLTFEHHKTIARVKSAHKREDWLNKADKQGLSTRRLRKSIILGRIAKESELKTDKSQKGIDNHIHWINGMVRWWKIFKEDPWLDQATREQVDTMLTQFRKVEDIFSTLEDYAQSKEPTIDL